jgi:hypothetical protein
MKLNAAQVHKVEEQLGVEAVDEANPVTPKLKQVFGDHTFFVDAQGLNIVEPDVSAQSSSGNVVKIATWNEARTGLRANEPEVLPVTVKLTTDS